MSSTETHTIEVRRTARYTVRGNRENPREVWFLLHGYAQIAEEFLEDFEALDDGARLLVAPEGLSRFYRRGSNGEVAASWMTSVEREAEIEDYVAYLEAVWDAIEPALGAETQVHVLGFSQGGATAARWAVRSSARIQRLILWGSGLAPELFEQAAALNRLDLQLVVGRSDRWISDERYGKELQRLRDAGIEFTAQRFEGGHEIAADPLTKLF